MGKIVHHILTHKTGRLSFRRAFPAALRPFIDARAEGCGADGLKVSLGATDLSAPGVLSKYDAASARYDAIVAKAVRRMQGTYDPLDAPRIAYLAKVFEADWHAEEEKSLADRTGDWREQRLAGWLWLLDEYKEARAERDLEAMVEWWGGSAKAIAEHAGFVLDPNDHEGLERLARAFNDVAIGISDASKARLAGNLVPVPAPPAPLIDVKPKAHEAVAAKVPLLQTFDEYAKAKGLAARTVYEWRKFIANLIAFVDHDDGANLTTDDVLRWRNYLLETPTSRGATRNQKTVRGTYLSALKALLGWAVQERKLPLNVAEPVVVHVPKRVKLRDRDFTTEEAGAILAASLIPVSGKLSKGHVLARRWIPWLAAYTGARVNELSQLRGQDIYETEGLWVLRITPEAGTVKGKTARIVPLHPHLIEQGFPEVAKALGDGPLFYEPDNQRVESKANRHFQKVGERIAQWVRDDVGITDPTLQPSHAWRHTFKTKALAAGVPERIADAIQGHAAKTVSRSYGSVPLATMAQAISSLPRFTIS